MAVNKKIYGTMTALVTPFLRGAVDEVSLRKLVRFQLHGGVHALVVNGTTAESPCLSEVERAQIFKIVKEEAARQVPQAAQVPQAPQVPLIMGTGTNSTAETIRQTLQAEALGADAALVVVPYYNKPPQRGLVQHFHAVAEAAKLPLILYNVPTRTITSLDLPSIIELSRHDNIIGIKEASGDIAFGKKIIQSCGEKFLVFSGDDATCFALMAQGAQGVISVASNLLPREFAQWTERLRKNPQSLHTDYLRYMNLMSHLFVEANPIPLKMALYLMGIIASPELRLPLVTLSETLTLELRSKLHELGLLDEKTNLATP